MSSTNSSLGPRWRTPMIVTTIPTNITANPIPSRSQGGKSLHQSSMVGLPSRACVNARQRSEPISAFVAPGAAGEQKHQPDRAQPDHNHPPRQVEDDSRDGDEQQSQPRPQNRR